MYIDITYARLPRAVDTVEALECTPLPAEVQYGQTLTLTCTATGVADQVTAEVSS